MKKLALLFFVALIGVVRLSAQQIDFKDLENYCAKSMIDFKQPGMSIGIVRDGKLVFSSAYGKRDNTKADPVTENTVFQLASLSKAFTAASIGILIDEGKLKWTDKVNSHLPEFKLYDPYVTANFTIRDLLCHRNGYETFDGDLLWYGTTYTREEIVKRFANLAPKHGFREKYGYSNIMFIAAAMLIEKKTGLTWEQFIQQRIFRPLEMRSSSSTMMGFKASLNKAVPHVNNNPNPYIDYNNAAGAVGINSNITDLSKWVTMWLNNGKFGDKQILKENTVREIMAMQTPQAVSAKSEENGVTLRGAASGWMVQTYKGMRVVHHSGGLPGFILNIALVPEKKAGVIVLTNGETRIPFAMTNYVLDLLSVGKVKDWTTEYLAAGANKPEEKAVVKEPVIFKNTELVGDYEDKMYGKATISINKEKAILTLEPTKQLFTAELEPLYKTTYRIKFADPFLPEGKVTFQLNSSGQIISFGIDLPNPDFNFYNLKFVKN